jgi:hypothetical protein
VPGAQFCWLCASAIDVTLSNSAPAMANFFMVIGNLLPFVPLVLEPINRLRVPRIERHDKKTEPAREWTGSVSAICTRLS